MAPLQRGMPSMCAAQARSAGVEGAAAPPPEDSTTTERGTRACLNLAMPVFATAAVAPVATTPVAAAAALSVAKAHMSCCSNATFPQVAAQACEGGHGRPHNKPAVLLLHLPCTSDRE